jgi:hypothetical protein
MKRLLLLALIIFINTSCDDKPVILRDSSGRLNDILVVASNEHWEGVVGDTIRRSLARPIDGIVRDEPLFTLNHIKPESFDGLLLKNRNYLLIQKGTENKVIVENNKYANPQTGIIVRGRTSQEIAQTMWENADNIIQLVSKGEVAHKNYLIKRTPLNTSRITDRMGIEINVPRTYRYAAQQDPDFFWLRRGIEAGTMDIMIYEVDYHMIKRDGNTVSDIVRVRDSVGALKIPVDEGGVFQTERAYTPYLNESQIGGQFAFETKGIWEVKNKWMAGPFINYAVYNKQRNNWLILEGYVSAPNTTQRNYLFELEAILKSVQFKDKKDLVQE